MTNSIREIRDADCVLVIGSNTGESHPVISYEVVRAVKRGATLIVIDPRRISLTRHAALHLRPQPATDTALYPGVLTCPDAGLVERALRALDFLVVQEIFPTETAQLAHVVLPAASFAEKNGTFVNTERRFQLVRPFLPPPGEARPDWQIIGEVGRRLGRRRRRPVRWEYASAAEVMREVALLCPTFRGISHERLARGGIQWPCPSPDHPGTPFLPKAQFVRGGAPGRCRARGSARRADLQDHHAPGSNPRAGPRRRHRVSGHGLRAVPLPRIRGERAHARGAPRRGGQDTGVQVCGGPAGGGAARAGRGGGGT